MERRLAAILAADLVGYSRIMGEDEAGTLTRLEGLKTEILDPLLVQFRGRVVKRTGDGFLVEFASVVEALACALAWQQSVEAVAGQVAEDRALRFRIGVNLGDVMVKDDDLYGDGVNVAARLEAMAEPGSVLVTQTVVSHAKGKLPVAFDDLGERRLKNIEEPVRIFRASPACATRRGAGAKARSRPSRLPVVAAALVLLVAVAGVVLWQRPWQPRVEPASESDMAFPLPDKPSIAVLPFSNLSDDPSQDYFADGMTEDLITDLSKISGLFVIARNSSFSYKGQQVKVRQVAEDLGVRYVLEGSVRRSDDEVRINAQLIDATTGGHLWAERYDGSLDNVFALQDRLTEQIVTALAVQLTPGEQHRQAETETVVAEAYDAFLRGWTHFRRSTPADYAQARDYFEQAIELDPEYSQAFAALAATYWESFRREMFTAMQMDRHSTRQRAEEYLDKALANPTPLSLQVSAKMQVWWGRHEKAVAEAQKAVALNPNDAEAHITLAEMLTWDGQPEAALESVARARRLDPLNEANHAYVEGLARITLGQYQNAAVSLQRALDLNPEFLMAGVPLAVAYVNLDRLADAQAALKPYCDDVWCQNATTEAHWFPFKRNEDQKQFINGLVGAGLAE
jgi:TolB-like protein/class 3 adenylate cyclase/thioredoxin-like negative regulator of GroEL